jgi:hypothetical protein
MDGWVLEQLETFLQRWSTGQGLCVEDAVPPPPSVIYCYGNWRLCWGLQMGFSCLVWMVR